MTHYYNNVHEKENRYISLSYVVLLAFLETGMLYYSQFSRIVLTS